MIALLGKRVRPFLNTPHEYLKAQGFAAQILAVVSNDIAWDLDSAQVAIVEVDDTATLQNPTNQRAGFTYILVATQGADGDETLAFGAAYLWPGGVAPTLTLGAGAIDIFTFISDGTNMLGMAAQDFQ